jgi:hypothetical protein
MVRRFLHSKIGSDIVAVIALIAALALLIGSTGCQTDLIGPSASVKWIWKGENNNKEYLSRGSGMKSATGFVVGNPDCTQSN